MSEVSESMRTGFWIVAAALVIYSMFRGWREGPPRMVAGLAALGAAWMAAILGGKASVPALRMALDLPDFVLAIIGGVLIGLTVYSLCSLLIAVLLRRTCDQESGVVRLGFGIFGSLMGMMVGVVLVWILVLGLRLAGTIAEARIEAARVAEKQLVHESGDESDSQMALLGRGAAGDLRPPRFIQSLAQMKASVDSGAATAALNRVDVIPEQVYLTLRRVALVTGNPMAASRFLSCPGAEKIARHPKIAALAQRPEIAEAVRRRAYIGLLRHPEVVAVANDPDLAADLRSFDLEAALDYALSEAGGASLPATLQ